MCPAGRQVNVNLSARAVGLISRRRVSLAASGTNLPLSGRVAPRVKGLIPFSYMVLPWRGVGGSIRANDYPKVLTRIIMIYQCYCVSCKSLRSDLEIEKLTLQQIRDSHDQCIRCGRYLTINEHKGVCDQECEEV